MKETIDAKKNGKNIELDDVIVVNEQYQDLSKEPEEKKEVKEETTPAEPEEKTEVKAEEKVEEKKEEPVVEAPKVEVPPVIETPKAPTPEPEAPAIGGFEIPSAPISEPTPSVQFPSTPEIPDIPVVVTPQVEPVVSPNVTAEPSFTFAQGLTPDTTVVNNNPDKFATEQELNDFYDELVAKANRRHEEEVNNLDAARRAALGNLREETAIKAWRNKLMDYSQYEQPVAPATTYSQAEDPSKKFVA